MPAASTSEDELRRRVLRDLAVLDTPDDDAFDALVRCAAQLCGCPVALIALVDSQRVWFKARHGLTLREAQREGSFCTHAIEHAGVFEVPDAWADARFATDPLGAGPNGFRFYAGVNIRVDGAAIGSFCVVDTVPRRLDIAQAAALCDMALAATELLKRHRRVSALDAERQRLLDFALASGDWMWEADADWRYTWISGVFEPITGEPSEALIGRCIADVPQLDALGDPRADGSTLHDLLRAGQPFSRALCAKDTPRGRLTISRSAVPVRDATGAVIGWRGTARDMTQRIAIDRQWREQGDLLHQLSAQVPGAIYQIRRGADGHGRFEFYNDRMLEMLGLSGEALMADSSVLYGVIHADDRERVRGLIVAAEAQGSPLDVDYRVARPDRGERWLRVSSTCERLADGSVVWRGFAADVTERKHIELALRASQAHWQMAADATGIGVAEVDLSTRQMRLDARACENHGLPFPHPALSLDDWFAAITTEDRAAAASALERSLRPGDGRLAARYRFQHPDGTFRWLEMIARVEHDAAGEPVSLIGTCRDVTEQMAVEALRRDKDMAQRASRAKSEFLSRVSHELRTPLNGILGFAQLMALDRTHALAPEQQHRLERVQRSGQHLLALVDDVLEIARIEGSDFMLLLRAVDLARVLESCRMIVEPLAAAHGVRLASSLSGPCWVQGDERALEQVLINLISNAIKYNRAGGAVHIDLALESEGPGEGLALSIRDEGAGLSADQQAQLFQPFHRLGAERHRVEGTGLGLVIARQLTIAMQGTLSVSSPAGEGCRFTLRLAACAAPDTPEDSQVATLEPAPATDDGRRHVLYIEDEPVNVVLMQEVFRSSGHWTLHTATDGAQGLAMARSLRPDLLLVDINLPDMSGTSLVRRLRSDPSTAGLRCIALSADAVQEQIAAARAAGFDDYWTKPIHVARMLSALSSVLAAAPQN